MTSSLNLNKISLLISNLTGIKIGKVEQKIINDLTLNLNNKKLDESLEKKIIESITVNESYFFRDFRTFSLLKKYFTHFLDKKQSLNVWSLGCSTGEEAYSTAIIMDEMGLFDKNNDIRIFGFDINESVIKKAEKGLYSSLSFRNSQFNSYQDKYFKRVNYSNYQLIPKIINKVKFFKFNISIDLFEKDLVLKYSKPDIILCKNLLMYIKDDSLGKIINRLFEIKSEAGIIIPASHEAYFFSKQGISHINEDDVLIFKNQNNLLMDNENNESFFKEILSKSIYYLNLDDKSLSLNYVNYYLESFPNDILALYIKGNINYLENNLFEADKYIDKILFLNENNSLANYLKGCILIKKADYPLALNFLKKSKRLINDKIDNCNYLSFLSLNENELIDFINITIEIVPDL